MKPVFSKLLQIPGIIPPWPKELTIINKFEGNMTVAWGIISTGRHPDLKIVPAMKLP